MTDQQFKPGDVVILKSGSPKMTVAYTDDENYIYCSWYDFNTHTWREYQKFPAIVLEMAT